MAVWWRWRWPESRPLRVKSLHLIEPPYLSLLPDDSDVSSVIEQGKSIFRNAAKVGPEQTATAFMEMLIGPAALADLRESPAWPGIVREAGRTAYEQFPVEYPPGSLAELSVEFPAQVYTGGRSHPGLQKLARRLAELIPAAGPGRGAGRHSRGAAVHRALPPGAARGHGRRGRDLLTISRPAVDASS